MTNTNLKKNKVEDSNTLPGFLMKMKMQVNEKTVFGQTMLEKPDKQIKAT